MASAKSTYGDRLHLAGAVERYKEYLSTAHLPFLVQKALEETPGGTDKLDYILALAKKCKTGLVSVAFLATQIDKEYSLSPSRQEKEGGVKEDRVEGWVDMDTDTDGADDQDDHAQDTELEEEEPHANDKVKKIIERYGSTFFMMRKWVSMCQPFYIPTEDCVLDVRDIEKLRTSTSKDFATATPKPMPAYIAGPSVRNSEYQCVFKKHEKSYRLCKKVAVSFDGTIYRATDAEIKTALREERYAPRTDAATYVKAVQEIRRQHEIKRARQNGSG